MTEAQIQTQMIRYLTGEGWMAIKLVQTNTPGIPDLLCLKEGTALFIEVKRPGQHPTDLQAYRLEKLRQHGFVAIVVRTLQDVQQLLASLTPPHHPVKP